MLFYLVLLLEITTLSWAFQGLAKISHATKTPRSSKIFMSSEENKGRPGFDDEVKEIPQILADGTPYVRNADGTISAREVESEFRHRFNKPCQNPKLVTFDATNTIIRLKAEVGLFYREAIFKAFKYSVRLPNPQEFTKAFKTAVAAKTEEQPCYGIGQGASSFEWWADVVQETYYIIGRKYGIPKVWIDQVLPGIQDELYNDLFRTPLAWEAMPDVRLVLEGLNEWRDHNNGPKVALLTNFDERLTDILKALDLHRFFDFIITSREIGVSKPKQQCFDIALTRAGLYDAKEAVHVGDDWDDDILAAINSGWHAVWLHSRKAPDMDDPRYEQYTFSECYRLRSVLSKFGIEYQAFGQGEEDNLPDSYADDAINQEANRLLAIELGIIDGDEGKELWEL